VVSGYRKSRLGGILTASRRDLGSGRRSSIFGSKPAQECDG
jgi:hypothetical protein